MRRLAVDLALAVTVLGACTSSPGMPATPLSPAATAGMTAEAASPAPLEPATTSAPPGPTPMPPPPISPEFFSQVKAMHEYWPVVRKAVGLFDEAHFGLVETAWALSPDGRYVAVAGCDSEAGGGNLTNYLLTTCEKTALDTVAHAFLLILDAKTESVIATLPETGQEVTVRWLTFTHDSNRLVYRLDNGKTGNWDIASARIAAVMPEEMGSESPVISPDDKSMAYDYSDQSYVEHTKIWDLQAGRLIVELPGSGLPVSFSPDGRSLLVEDGPYSVIYDTGTWQKVSQRILIPDGHYNRYAISPDLAVMAICDKTLPAATARIWSVPTGELITKTAKGEWGGCGRLMFSPDGRLMFSPDGRLLLRFDDHGAGPVIWQADGWKLVQANPNVTPFVLYQDLFVDKLEFSQDGRSVLVGTFKRLTLYTLPEGVEPATAAPPVASPTAGPSAPLAEIPPASCDIVVTGSAQNHVQRCFPADNASAGAYNRLVISMTIKDENFTGVDFEIPLYMMPRGLKTGQYVIGDHTNGAEGGLTATYTYYDPSGTASEIFESYAPGTITFSQTGQYWSGSFSFGARTPEGREIKVQGTFENIPFDPVNIP